MADFFRIMSAPNKADIAATAARHELISFIMAEAERQVRQCLGGEGGGRREMRPIVLVGAPSPFCQPNCTGCYERIRHLYQQQDATWQFARLQVRYEVRRQVLGTSLPTVEEEEEELQAAEINLSAAQTEAKSTFLRFIHGTVEQALRNETTGKEQKLKELHEKTVAEERKLEEVQRRREETEKRIATIHARRNQQRAVHEANIQKLTAECEAQRTEARKLTAENDAKRTESHRLTADNELKRHESCTLKSECEQAKRDLAEKEQRLREIMAEQVTEYTKLQDLKQQVAAAKAEAAKIENLCSQLDAGLVEFKKQKLVEQETIADLQKQQAEERKKLARAQKTRAAEHEKLFRQLYNQAKAAAKIQVETETARSAAEASKKMLSTTPLKSTADLLAPSMLASMKVVAKSELLITELGIDCYRPIAVLHKAKSLERYVDFFKSLPGCAHLSERELIKVKWAPSDRYATSFVILGDQVFQPYFECFCPPISKTERLILNEDLKLSACICTCSAMTRMRQFVRYVSPKIPDNTCYDSLMSFFCANAREPVCLRLDLYLQLELWHCSISFKGRQLAVVAKSIPTCPQVLTEVEASTLRDETARLAFRYLERLIDEVVRSYCKD